MKKTRDEFVQEAAIEIFKKVYDLQRPKTAAIAVAMAMRLHWETEKVLEKDDERVAKQEMGGSVVVEFDTKFSDVVEPREVKTFAELLELLRGLGQVTVVNMTDARSEDEGNDDSEDDIDEDANLDESRLSLIQPDEVVIKRKEHERLESVARVAEKFVASKFDQAKFSYRGFIDTFTKALAGVL